MKGTLIILAPRPENDQQTACAAEPTLEQLQKAVGGWIEPMVVYWLGKLRQAYVNEKGILLDLIANPRATDLVTACSPSLFGRIIVGNLAIWLPDSPSESCRIAEQTEELSSLAIALEDLRRCRAILDRAAALKDHFSYCDRTMGDSHPCTCGMQSYQEETQI